MAGLFVPAILVVYSEAPEDETWRRTHQVSSTGISVIMSQADTRADIPSIVERTRAFKFNAPVVSAHFLGGKPIFVLGEEALLLVESEGEPRRIAVHAGAILSSASDSGRVLTGGDDGRVVATGSEGECVTIFTDT